MKKEESGNEERKISNESQLCGLHLKKPEQQNERTDGAFSIKSAVASESRLRRHGAGDGT